MKKLCVFMGSAMGTHAVYQDTAQQLGKELAARNIHLVYGAGSTGLMGTLADATLVNGGQVTGVITPQLMEIEGHSGLTQLHIVNTMHERKQLLIDHADAFLVFPGGLGTLEEMFETWNASKLKLHQRPLGLLNINHYFSKLLDFIHQSVDQGFILQKHRDLLHIDTDPIELLNKII